MDHGNARLSGFMRRPETHEVLPEMNYALIIAIGARKELDQRTFPRSVFSGQYMNLPRF